LSVYLVSPIVAATGTSSIVYYTMLSAWGEDMQFYQHYSQPVTGYAQSAISYDNPSPTLGSRLHTLSMVASIKEYLLQPVLYSQYTYSGTQTTYPAQPQFIPISTAFLTGSPIWNYCMMSYGGASGSLRMIVRYIAASAPDATKPGATGTTPLSIQYYPSCPYPTVPNPTGNNYINGMFATGNSGNGATNHPLINNITVNQIVAFTSATGSGLTYTASTPVVVLDPVIQREVVVEVPDTYCMYKSQPTTLMQQNQNLITGYNPSFDANCPFLVVQPLDNTTGIQFVANFQVWLVAGDDFKFFWFNGGPSAASEGMYTYNGATPVLDPRSQIGYN